MKTIMVTGGNGLLGYGMRQVTQLESRDGYKFVFVDIDDADLCDKEQTRALFLHVKIGRAHV